MLLRPFCIARIGTHKKKTVSYALDIWQNRENVPNYVATNLDISVWVRIRKFHKLNHIDLVDVEKSVCWL